RAWSSWPATTSRRPATWPRWRRRSGCPWPPEPAGPASYDRGPGARGGTGRHAGFRFLCLTVCGFESRRAHVTAPDPRDYPWPEPAVAGVLGPDGAVRRVPYDAGAGRVPVLAVGSNASPVVLRRKLGRLLATGLPVGTARVEGLGV